jgi:hypothetical protein
LQYIKSECDNYYIGTDRTAAQELYCNCCLSEEQSCPFQIPDNPPSSY